MRRRVDSRDEGGFSLLRHPGEAFLGQYLLCAFAVIIAMVCFHRNRYELMGALVWAMGISGVLGLILFLYAVRRVEEDYWRRALYVAIAVNLWTTAEFLTWKVLNLPPIPLAGKITTGAYYVLHYTAWTMAIAAVVRDRRWGQSRSMAHWLGVAIYFIAGLAPVLSALVRWCRQAIAA
ncbi:MAG: hypothetical protein KF688_08215 [Pirellulales bacterium]|nr:hypothetical protein [Pirellulales bacterium]